jgi:hypothetical protein
VNPAFFPPNFLTQRLQQLQQQQQHAQQQPPAPAPLASINGTRRIAIDSPISSSSSRQEDPSEEPD